MLYKSVQCLRSYLDQADLIILVCEKARLKREISTAVVLLCTSLHVLSTKEV